MQDKLKATFIPIELLQKYDKPGPRYTSYPTAPIWTEDLGVNAYRAALQSAAKRSEDNLALYCHIPFCERRCYYCGCNTCITKQKSTVDDYLDNLISEISSTSGLLESRKRVSQLHFGGGTPTFLNIDEFDRILTTLEKEFDFTDNCERSIEIDPRVTTTEQLDFLANRSFNRASLGVQDLDYDVQQAIGRIQPEKTVIRILEHCRKLNFKGINFDLIYGLPRQSVSGFRKTLKKVIDLRPDRLAVYSFAYLPNLKSNQLKINQNDLPTTNTKYQLFASAIEMFTEAGYRQIGMDHFALPDDELALAQKDGRLHRNFMGYTVQSAPEMIGFGMSSIGYINSSFFQNFSKLSSYNEAINKNDLAVYRGMVLSYDDLIRQYVINSLMCNFVLNFAAIKEKFGIDYHTYFAREHRDLKCFFEDSFLNLTPDRLEITEVGRTFVRNIAMTYDVYLQKDGKSKATFSRTI